MELFADNTKYLYLHVANERKDIEAVWLAKDPTLAGLLRARGYRSYYQYSLEGVWYALRAGTTVIDAYLQPENFRLSGTTRLVQLLHGKGMKKGGYKQPPPRRQDFIFTTSPFVTSMLPSSFTQQSTIKEVGYPRGDVLFTDIPGSDIGVSSEAKKLLTQGTYAKRLSYAPTFRRGAKAADIDAVLDFPELSKWLVANNYLLILSLHPKYFEQGRARSYDNIHFLEESDIYPLLPYLDVLITDYSSLFTDYLLLDRPMVFYAYDLESYKEKEGLSFDNYNEYTPGPKATTPKEFREVVAQILSKDTYKEERARVRSLYHTNADGNSAKRIMEILTADTSRNTAP